MWYGRVGVSVASVGWVWHVVGWGRVGWAGGWMGLR